MSPYPNEHACRIADPSVVKVVGSITKKHNGKSYRILVGKREGKTTTETQATRYPKNEWTAEEARAHCKNLGGSFEAARETQSMSEQDLANPAENPFLPTDEDE